jgi:hypothetical protein
LPKGKVTRGEEMKAIRVSKMGDKMRVIYLPTIDYFYQEKLQLKPKLSNHRIFVKVSKMGEKLVAVIPKSHWDSFPHRWEVFIKKVGK